MSLDIQAKAIIRGIESDTRLETGGIIAEVRRHPDLRKGAASRAKRRPSQAHPVGTESLPLPARELKVLQRLPTLVKPLALDVPSKATLFCAS